MVKKNKVVESASEPKKEPVYIYKVTYDKSGKFPSKKKRIELFESEKIGKLNNGIKVVLVDKKWCAVM